MFADCPWVKLGPKRGPHCTFFGSVEVRRGEKGMGLPWGFRLFALLPELRVLFLFRTFIFGKEKYSA